MARGTFVALTCVGVFALFPGAAAGVDLALDIKIEQPPVEPATGPSIAVTFVDGRDPGDGGGDPTSLGILKSSEPRRITHAGGLEAAEVVLGAVSGALGDSGFDARVGEAPTLPRLSVTLQKMTAKGLTRCKVQIKLRLELFPAGAGAPSWAETVTVKGSVTLTAGPEDLAGGYEDAMAAARRSMGEMFAAVAFGRVAGAEAEAEPVRRTTESESETIAAAPDGGAQIHRITDATEKEASAQLAGLCLTHFQVEFTFLGEDDSSEWTLTFVDEDGDDVGYVNLDDEETVEFDGDDEDLDEDADHGEPHRVEIQVDDDEVTLHIDGDEVLDDEDLDSYDECLHLEVIVDDDMTLSGFVVTPAGS